MDVKSYSLSKKYTDDNTTLERIKNKITNGDFKRGVSGWTGLYANIQTSNELNEPTLRISTSLDGGGGAFQYREANKNHIFYFSCEMFNVSASNYTVRLTKDNSTSTIHQSTLFTSKDEWQKDSFLITPDMVADITTGFRIYIRQGNSRNQIIHAKNVMLVDLTEIFGEGNEPTKEEFESMFSFFPDRAPLNRIVEWLFDNKGNGDSGGGETPIVVESSFNFDVIDSSAHSFNSVSDFIPESNINTHEKIYGLYDDLMNQYPDYITKTLMGTEYTGLPIYRYDFEPPEVRGSGSLPLPKILYITSTHGSEYKAVADGIRFFSELCDSWKENDVLKMLRWHVSFTVVPCLNPWGHNNVNRKNSRGVDINRNFPEGWTYNPDTESTMYAGEEPLSEVETQLAYDLFTTESFIFVVDHHNANTFASRDEVMYTVSKDEIGNMKGYTNMIGHFMNYKFKADFDFVDQGERNFSRVLNYKAENADGMMFGSFECPGMIFESLFGWGGTPGGTNEDLQKYYVESLGVVLYTAYKSYKTFESKPN